jgi:antitoxin component of MazEF toxin-antitoxin module
MRLNMEGKLKRWGNSYGVLISKEEVSKKNIREGETILIDIQKKQDLMQLFGFCKSKRSMKEIMADIKEGYDE